MPYWLVGTVIVGPLVGAEDMFSDSLALQFGAYGVALPMAAVTALLFPLTRPLAVAAGAGPVRGARRAVRGRAGALAGRAAADLGLVHAACWDSAR